MSTIGYGRNIKWMKSVSPCNMEFMFRHKPKLTKEQIVKMKCNREDDVLIQELGKEYGISDGSIYRLARTI
jgi:hypothetical protein